MTNTISVKFNHVSKIYSLTQRQTLKGWTTYVIAKNIAHQFYALRNVSFSIKTGQVVGLIGPNGSGKTTILKLIAAITRPSAGTITVNGSVVPVIELSIGFHDELTGRENIYISGVILGMTKKEVSDKFQDIVQFADLEQFIDTPIKKYSTGMRAKLGISIAMFRSPDILLLDEALTVSDKNFVRRLMPKLESMIQNNTTVIVVSHNYRFLKNLCNRIIGLDKGRIIGSETILRPRRRLW